MKENNVSEFSELKHAILKLKESETPGQILGYTNEAIEIVLVFYTGHGLSAHYSPVRELLYYIGNTFEKGLNELFGYLEVLKKAEDKVDFELSSRINLRNDAEAICKILSSIYKQVSSNDIGIVFSNRAWRIDASASNIMWELQNLENKSLKFENRILRKELQKRNCYKNRYLIFATVSFVMFLVLLRDLLFIFMSKH